MPPLGPLIDPAVRLKLPLVHNKLEEEVTPETVGAAATVKDPEVPLALVAHAEAKFTVTLYAPLAPTVGLNDGETFDELVVAAIPGPDQ